MKLSNNTLVLSMVSSMISFLEHLVFKLAKYKVGLVRWGNLSVSLAPAKPTNNSQEIKTESG